MAGPGGLKDAWMERVWPSRDELYSAQSTNLTNTITNYTPGYLFSELIHADHEKGNMTLSTH